MVPGRARFFPFISWWYQSLFFFFSLNWFVLGFCPWQLKENWRTHCPLLIFKSHACSISLAHYRYPRNECVDTFLRMPLWWVFFFFSVIISMQEGSGGEDVEKLEPSHIAGRNVKWCIPYGKQWQFLKKLNRITTHDNSAPRYIPKESKTGIQTKTSTKMFTTALFTRAKR